MSRHLSRSVIAAMAVAMLPILEQEAAARMEAQGERVQLRSYFNVEPYE